MEVRGKTIKLHARIELQTMLILTIKIFLKLIANKIQLVGSKF